MKIFRLKKKQKVLDKKKQRMISASLNSLNKLDILKELEQKKHEKKKKTRALAIYFY
jgi:hypothetical protein